MHSISDYPNKVTVKVGGNTDKFKFGLTFRISAFLMNGGTRNCSEQSFFGENFESWKRLSFEMQI